MNHILSPLQHFLLLKDVLAELFRLDFTVFRTVEDISGFCDKNCFYPPLQKTFTSAGLEEFFQKPESRGSILHATDHFRIHTIFFYLEESYIAMGPFCPLLFSQKDARILIEDYQLLSATPADFLSYASCYPFLPEKQALDIVRAVLHSIYPSEDDRPVLSLAPALLQDDEENMDQNAVRMNYALLLEKRYSYEKHFRQDIMDGNQRAALMNLTNMEQDVSYLKRIGNTLESEKIGAAITRTTARLAAVDGGLPGLVADRISNQNTIDTFYAKTIDEILQAKEKMVRAYCASVRSIKKKHYSVLIQSVLYEMERNFQEEFSLDRLAGELAVSKNYLIRRFREEVGDTPVQYLTGLRLNRAAMLLTDHVLSVQDIANAVGIPDSNYFTKLFKKAYGMTPQQYRKSRIV